MTDELYDKRRAFHSALKRVGYNDSVVIGSYVGALIAKIEVLERENKNIQGELDYLNNMPIIREIIRYRNVLQWIVDCSTDYQSINKAKRALRGGES